MNLATGLAPPLAGVGLASLVALQMIVLCMYIQVVLAESGFIIQSLKAH